ncbi:isocitrate/isopropylmalate family dehydrogenase [Paenarthrobacter sp. NPDC058040]|uniref:isocitrate/isopropylmalate family dehydrogenase n=1 Tax=unclassified Paenarthrobacter TaxID=2634190 RepID=UPI0036D8053C
MKKHYVIDVIPGDGIGPELMPGAITCLEAIAYHHGFNMEWRTHSWNSERHLIHGSMMPADGLQQLAGGDAIFAGTFGLPGRSRHVEERELLSPIRSAFDQYVDVLPARLLPGMTPQIAGVDHLNAVLVQANLEGTHRTPKRPEQSAVLAWGVGRVARYALQLAEKRSRRLVSATGSDGVLSSTPFWDEVVSQAAEEYPSVAAESVPFDSLAARAILNPETLDVVVASNLYGEEMAALLGAVSGVGHVAPVASINPEGHHPSMFKPCHGPALDIVGQGIANPIGQLWAGAMLLEHLGETEAAICLSASFEEVLSSGTSTPDLGGNSSTQNVTDAVLNQIARAAQPALV